MYIHTVGRIIHRRLNTGFQHVPTSSASNPTKSSNNTGSLTNGMRDYGLADSSISTVQASCCGCNCCHCKGWKAQDFGSWREVQGMQQEMQVQQQVRQASLGDGAIYVVCVMDFDPSPNKDTKMLAAQRLLHQLQHKHQEIQNPEQKRFWVISEDI